jgi:hypothetical protein
MVPGLTEREFHALETIRREWLDGELTLRHPAPAQTRPARKNRRTRGRELLALAGRCLRAPLAVGWASLVRRPVETPEPIS